ncbi:hypothetical protein [Jiella sp. M17.18]|uniref:hypothetical protein n=1 Tax=Jiella sp. M17.18 TaxID=3234247 RepID=UPI0034DF5E20
MTLPIEKAVDRLEAILTAEVEALRSGNAINLAEITTRKNQSLLEFTRLARGLSDPDPTLRVRLEGLRKCVEENQRVLGLHIQASHEIASLIARSITEADSDGTYSAQIRRKSLAK